jgi:hypothetical protein
MPIKNNGYNSTKLNARRDKRRMEAETRKDKFDLLTPQEKLKSLVGNAAKQRMRLAKQIAELPPPAVKEKKKSK